MKNAILTLALMLSACASSVYAQRAEFEFAIPPDATFVVNKQTVPKSDKEVQRYQSPVLAPNMYYTYDIEITLSRNNQTYSQKDRIMFMQGQSIRRSYMNLLNDAEAASYPRSNHVAAELAALDKRTMNQIQAFARRQQSKSNLGLLSPTQQAFLDELDYYLSAGTFDALGEGGGVSAISDVSYDRLSTNRLKVSLEAGESSTKTKFLRGSILTRNYIRYICIYDKTEGDWVLSKYTTTSGASLGDFVLRWENQLRGMRNPPAVEAGVGSNTAKRD